jgi:hypothetical protein
MPYNKKKIQQKARQQTRNDNTKYYCSEEGLHTKILHSDEMKQLALVVGGQWNGHMWIKKPNGDIFDPTPPNEQTPPLRQKSGRVVPYYEEYDLDFQKIILQNKINWFSQAKLPDGITTLEGYLNYRYQNPEQYFCFQNCMAYKHHHPDCEIKVGAFGYVLDDPDMCCDKDQVRLMKRKGIKKYIALDYGY